MELEWHTERRRVDELVPYEHNPRKMTEKQVEDLKASLEKFNVVETPVINTDNKVVAGHQRLKVLKMLGRGKEEIDVRVPNRLLTDEEFKEYLVRSNKNTGMWDFDILANAFDVSQLNVWGFDQAELGFTAFKGTFEPEMDKDKLSESMESYLGGNIKHISLYFSKEDYDGILARLDAVMSKTETESHTEAFLKLLEFFEKESE